jgi:hypothetical protein
MAPVIVAGIAAAAPSVIGGAALTVIATNFAIGAAMGFIGQMMMDAPAVPDFAPPTAFGAATRTSTVRQPISFRRAVYGETRTSGPLTFYEATDDTRYHHLVIPISEGPIGRYTTIWIDDKAIPVRWIDSDGILTDGDFSGKVRLRLHHGDAGQVADPDLALDTSVTSAFVGNGIAYIYARIDWDQDTFPNGLPDIGCTVMGRKVRDTRLGYDVAIPNPTMCLRDYLRSDLFGMGMLAAEIDDTEAQSSANTCDEFATTKTVAVSVSQVDTATDELEFTDVDGKSLQTGDRVQMTTDTTLPAGLALSTDYYVVLTSEEEGARRIKLATSYEYALAGDITNLAENARDLTASGWSSLDLTGITANQAIAPDGTTTMDEVIEGTTVSGYPRVSQATAGSVVSGDTYIVGIEAKLRDAGRPVVAIQTTGNLDADVSYFNVSTGAVGTKGSNHGRSGIEALGNDVYFCWVEVDASGAGSATVLIYAAPSETVSWTGDGASGMYYRQMSVTAGTRLPWPIDTAGSETRTVVTLTDVGVGGHTINKQAEPRYTCNGTLSSQEKPNAILEEMRMSMAGRLVYTGGVWFIMAGAYRSPTITITDDDIVSSVSVETRLSRRDRYNGVKGVFASPVNEWQASDYPFVQSTTYKTADGSIDIWRDLDLTYTTRSNTAQRIARIDLERSRREISVGLSVNLMGLQLRCGDTVMLTLDRFGFSSKVFEITEWRLGVQSAGGGPSLSVFLQLRATDSAVYTFDAGSDEAALTAAPRSVLPNPFTAAAPTSVALATDSFLSDGGELVSRISVSWTAPADYLVIRNGEIELQFKRSLLSTWEPSFKVQGADTSAFVPGVENDVNYDVRIRSVNHLGIKSAWQTTSNFKIGAASGGADSQRDYGSVTDIASSTYARGGVAAAVDKTLDYEGVT